MAFAPRKTLQINRSMPVKSMWFRALKLFQTPDLASSFTLLKSNSAKLNLSSGAMLADIKIVLISIKIPQIRAEAAI